MAKLFNKEPKDFLRLDGTKKFIETLINHLNIVADVPRYKRSDIIYSNNKAGTFMHRKLALKFAAWLDVKFELWVFDTIDNILFKNYNTHRQKSIELLKKKEELKTLEMQADKSDNVLAKNILTLQKEVEKLKRDKTKAIKEQTDQLSLNLQF